MIQINNVISSSPPPATPLVPAGSPASSTGSVSFGDVIDAINPLQHIPVLSGLYRAATGTTISAGSKLVGDTLYGFALGGGLIGAASSAISSVADVAVQQTTGEDISQHVVATVSSLTSPPANAAVPLTPNTNVTLAQAAAAANLQAIAQTSPLTTQYLPPLTNQQQASAQYQRAAALDAMNKMLVKL